jgi:Leucine-rich repeat (LRR) protein
LGVLSESGQLHALSRAKGEGDGRAKDDAAIRSLDLSRTPVTDAGLEKLRGLQELTTLRLNSTKVTGVGLLELKDLKKLTTLELGDTEVTDAGLRALKELKQLTDLQISGAQLTDKVLGVLREIGVLHALNQARGKDGNAKDDASIRALNLKDTKVTNEGLKALKGLKKLEYVDFPDKTVTDQRLRALCEAGLLHVLDQANGEERSTINDDAAIRSLDLRETQVTAVGLKALKDLKQLTTLKLRETQLTNEALAALREIGLLHAFSGAVEIDSYGREGGRAKDDASIWWLSLANTRVTDAGLKELKGLKKLRTLILRGTRIRGEGLDDLKELKELYQLDLRGTQVTTGDIKALEEALPRCRISRESRARKVELRLSAAASPRNLAALL